MTEIKFCGLTSLDDCLAAVDAGAGWLGFNFYERSPRYVTQEACRQIVLDMASTLGEKFLALRLVGVFVNVEPDEILRTLDFCQLHLAQLSGGEPLETLRALGERGYKAVRAGPDKSLLDRTLELPRRADAPACLIDAAAAGQFGGTGLLADWEQARQIARSGPIFLAGGLTGANVSAAVRQVCPWGVDAASGIESLPGKKDHGKMRAFVRAVREADLQGINAQTGMRSPAA